MTYSAAPMSRVLVLDPHASLEEVRAVLSGTNSVVEAGTHVAGTVDAGHTDDLEALLIAFDTAVGAEDIARLSALKIIATTSIGYEQVDIEAAAGRGIWVCNVPDYCVEEVADTTIGLLLALTRGIVALDRSVRLGQWSCKVAGPLAPLSEVRLGLIGFGRIGRAVAARANALRIEVWAYDPLVAAEAIIEAKARPASLNELLASCSAFSLHVPLTSQTEGLIGAAEIARMPRGAVVINTARGRLVDVDALLRGLEDEHLGGAALDVLPVEPPTDAAPAPVAPNLIVTPHAAWYSEAALRAETRGAALAISDLLQGRTPRNAVAGPSLEGLRSAVSP